MDAPSTPRLQLFFLGFMVRCFIDVLNTTAKAYLSCVGLRSADGNIVLENGDKPRYARLKGH